MAMFNNLNLGLISFLFFSLKVKQTGWWTK